MAALTETIPQNVNGRPTITRGPAHWPAPSSWAHAAAQLLMGSLLFSAWTCSCDAKSAADLGRLADALADVRFVAYTAREFAVLDGQPHAASAEGVCQDLRLLRPYFDGIITYSVRDGHEHVPALARALGFRAVVIGVWDPASEPELETARRHAGEIFIDHGIADHSLFNTTGAGAFVGEVKLIRHYAKQQSGLLPSSQSRSIRRSNSPIGLPTNKIRPRANPLALRLLWDAVTARVFSACLRWESGIDGAFVPPESRRSHGWARPNLVPCRPG